MILGGVRVPVGSWAIGGEIRYQSAEGNLPTDQDFRAQWEEVPDIEEYPNGFRAQWEQFLRDVDAGRPHGYDLAAGVRGLQLVEAGLQSSEEGRRIVIGEGA